MKTSSITTGWPPICASDRNTWVAAYGAVEPALGHTLWQSTDGKNGSQITSWAGAGKCDTSVFHGTLSQLAAVISREDDLPFTKEEILDLVKQGVAAELRAGIDARGITPAQGAEAAFDTRNALKVLAQEVAELKDLVKRALPDAQRTTGTP